jgi:hypothetical protein
VIEAEIRGKPPDERQQVRQARSKPLIDDLETWLRASLEKLSRKSDTAAAIMYALNLWPARARYCDDGMIEGLEKKIFLDPKDPNYNAAVNAPDIPGSLMVISHGSPTSVNHMNAKQLEK